MSTWEHFRKAPVQEALIDIQVNFSSEVALASLRSFHDHVRDEYPEIIDRTKMEGEVRLRPGVAEPTIQRETKGLLFMPPDRKRVVQVRQDGYTFNKVRPYEGWASFQGEAKRHWQAYSKLFAPSEVTRVGLRYINRINLPLPIDDFSVYLNTFPEVARELPQALSSLFLRVQIPDPNRGILATVTETVEPLITEAEEVSLWLDIDVVHLNAHGKPDTDRIWSGLESMHEYKNEIFFSSITERTKDLLR